MGVRPRASRPGNRRTGGDGAQGSPPRDPSSTRKTTPARRARGAGQRSPASRRPAQPRAGRGRALLLGLAGVVAAACAALLALVFGFGRARAPDRGRVVEINWPDGLDAGEAAALLAAEGLVESERAMALYLGATGGTEAFVPGPHLLFEGATPRELRQLLTRAEGRPTAKLTIPEGFSRFDIAARLEKLRIAGRKTFLAATADGALLDALGIERGGAVGAESAEGYLFPATYELALDSDARDVARRLVAESDRRWSALAAQGKDGLAALQATLGWGRREVLTLASIIEKEAVVEEERPLIASVFLNRLLDPSFRSRKLQSDATALYGCVAWPEEAPSCAEWSGKPTPAVVRDPKNRYSTYAHPGLPPGPIANPGAPSIAAVLAPAATKYLYFVAAGGGRHRFSESLDDHNDAVQKRRDATAP
ncbi:endolytic transglycosylase MltG [Sorangium atrum]|uniref:Endolytic murein transglycosylase n=1 Tax=Sorangium atrum TaxID=2995308 RepID=A0ABT5BSC1_9BACT|nr:endolytic transglycosylase MltG [Sorangium aterium]MDC0676439.1 endolytic transglycosylase MltG [Sorangium aterium]